MVEKILLALENVFVDAEGLEWLAVLRGKVPSLFTMMLKVDIIMTKRKKVIPVEAFEMGARVPGELFARLMLDFDTTKPGALAKALKGLEDFTKFVVLPDKKNNNVEVDRQKILQNGSRLIFGLLDSAVTEESAKDLRAIKWNNSKGMLGKFCCACNTYVARECRRGRLPKWYLSATNFSGLLDGFFWIRET